MKALIYARQSSGNDDVSESVEAQIQNCLKLAEKESIEITGIFRDLNSSGETYPEGAENIAAIDPAYQEWLLSQSVKKNFRCGLGALLARLDSVNIVIVNELTRLYRPINSSFLEGHINYLLKKHNVKLMQVQGGSIDLGKFDQQLITSIKNQILYDDLQKKRNNSINAFRIKRDSGKICCGTKAFGLQYLGNDRIGIRQERVQIIKFIFDSICEHKSYSSIIRECNLRFKDHAFFYASTIFNIARQPLYAGLQYNTAGELIKNIQMQGQEIISVRQWAEVQRIITSKRRQYHNKAKKHWLPLSGRLFCGYCGRHMICTIDKGRIYYICNRGNLDSASGCCRNSRIRFESGAYGKPALQDVLPPLFVTALLEREKTNYTRQQELKQLDFYNTRLNTLKTMEEKLCNLYLDGILNDEQLKEMLNVYTKKKKKISEYIMKLQNAASPVSPKEQQREVLLNMFKKLQRGKIANSVYQTLLDESCLKITVYREYISISTLYGTFPLPRLWRNNRCSLPEWQLSNSRKYSAAASGHDSVFGKIRITYFTGSEKLLADFGRIIISTK